MKCRHCGGTGEEPDWREAGFKMRSLRKENGISGRWLAKKLKISPSYLSDMELGKRQYSPSWQCIASDVIVTAVGSRK